MHVYIEIEIVKRELSGKLLVALELIGKGHTVILADRETINKIGKDSKTPKGVLFLKDINSQKNRINDYKKFIQNGFKLVSQDEEIGCFADKNFKEYYEWRFRGNKSFKFFEKYFCWGSFDHDYLINKIPKHKIIKTGSPRIDIAIESKPNKRNRDVLFCLNHNLFWKRDFVERSIIDIEGLNNLKTKKKIDNLYLNESKDLLLFSYLIKLLYALSQIKDIKVKIRPHPTHDLEKLTYYFKSIKFLKKFKIVSKEDLINDISKSNFIIQTGCTSSIEGTLNQKKVIFFNPKDKFLNNYKNNTFISKIGFNISSIEKLIKFINSKHQNENFINKKIKKDMIKIKERVLIDQCSFKRMSKEIHKIKISEKNNINFNKFNNGVSETILKNLKLFIKSKIKQRIGYSKKLNIFETKFPPFKKKLIIYKLNNLKKKFNLNVKFKLDKVNDRFLILKKDK